MFDLCFFIAGCESATKRDRNCSLKRSWGWTLHSDWFQLRMRKSLFREPVSRRVSQWGVKLATSLGGKKGKCSHRRKGTFWSQCLWSTLLGWSLKGRCIRSLYERQRRQKFQSYYFLRYKRAKNRQIFIIQLKSFYFLKHENVFQWTFFLLPHHHHSFFLRHFCMPAFSRCTLFPPKKSALLSGN